MKDLKEEIIEAVQDATDTVDGTVSIPILDHFLDGILANQCKIADARQQRELLATVVENFIGWRDKLHSEIRGGKLMFNVPKHYKWLDESELFTYYMDVAGDSAIRPPLGILDR